MAWQHSLYRATRARLGQQHRIACDCWEARSKRVPWERPRSDEHAHSRQKPPCRLSFRSRRRGRGECGRPCRTGARHGIALVAPRRPPRRGARAHPRRWPRRRPGQERSRPGDTRHAATRARTGVRPRRTIYASITDLLCRAFDPPPRAQRPQSRRIGRARNRLGRIRRTGTRRPSTAAP